MKVPAGRGKPFEVSDLGERSPILQMSLEERSFESIMVGELEMSFTGVGVGVGVPPIAPLALYRSSSSGLRRGEPCRRARKIESKRQEQDYWVRDRLLTPPCGKRPQADVPLPPRSRAPTECASTTCSPRCGRRAEIFSGIGSGSGFPFSTCFGLASKKWTLI